MNPMIATRWLGHASFLFFDEEKKLQIYVDPYNLTDPNLPKADLIFITHNHPDHFSPADIEKIKQESTTIIATPDVLEQITPDLIGITHPHTVSVLPNQSYDSEQVYIETLPAYNTLAEKFKFHPKMNNWVGYLLTINNQKIYHAGDTDFVPEMQSLATEHIDVALLPMGGTYTMEAAMAADAANAIQATYTIPMHYKRLLGDRAKDAEDLLTRSVTKSEVVILEENAR